MDLIHVLCGKTVNNIILIISFLEKDKRRINGKTCHLKFTREHFM